MPVYSEIKPAYRAAVADAHTAMWNLMYDTGKRGVEAQIAILNHDGFDESNGSYLLTSRDFNGHRNPNHTYSNLPAALIGMRTLASDEKRLWHLRRDGSRRLVIG